MRKFMLAARARLLSTIPVPYARKRLRKATNAQPLRNGSGGTKQLLVDVSVIINQDARTGIQRVVRALLLQLLKQPPAGYQVRPVYATRRHGYRYAPEHFGFSEVQISNQQAISSAVMAGAGDVFLGLDLAAHLLPLHQGQLASWKRRGATVHILVYDLLPVLHPHWFIPKTTRNFHRWLRAIAKLADSAICISNGVKTELECWLSRHYALAPGTLPVHTITLGADLASSAPSRGLPDNAEQLLSAFASKPTVLMVGTLEPRKGHSQILAALEELWRQNRDINLVIVGKPGWKTDPLQQTLRAHPQRGKQLYWLDKVSDEFLELLYECSTGVIVASQAEGFGLPLSEALRYRKPVLARDIPVFRENGGNCVTFFSDDNPESLAASIETWLASSIAHLPKGNMCLPTWQDSTHELLMHLKLGQNSNQESHPAQLVLEVTA